MGYYSALAASSYLPTNLYSMDHICTSCDQAFQVIDTDLTFYDEVSPCFNGKKEAIPPPKQCPDCRHLRRMTWRNERTLFRNTCAATGQTIISPLSPDKPFQIYENDYWYGGDWDAKEYGRDYDFNRPFFEQFRELMEAVPQLGRSAVSNQNCDYVNQCGWCKNCYLIFEADYNEGCLYANNIYDSRMCCDMLHSTNNELCYDCTDCRDSYNLRYSQNCDNCWDSWFLKNCIGCKHCIGCTNLRNKEYHIFNEPVSQADYQAKLKELQLEKRSGIERLQQQWTDWNRQFPQKCLQGAQNEDSSGDYLWQTQRSTDCFDVRNAQDCKRVYNSQSVKKVHDMLVFGTHQGAEFCYEVHEVGSGVKNLLFCDQTWDGAYDCQYCKLCLNNTHHCFGCVGLKHESYCILNKQYTPEEYDQLVPKIIEHMRSTGEWGEFFPSSISPFAYNETIAMNYFPLQKEEALAQGYAWKDDIDEAPAVKNIVPGDKLPETITEVPDDILDWAIVCTKSGRPFRIVSQELDFYRQQHIPLPQLHPDERHLQRMALRNPRQMWKRDCGKCGKQMKTTYAPQQPETVWCEDCYLKEVY